MGKKSLGLTIAAITVAIATYVSSQPDKPASPQKTGEIRGIISYCGPSGTSGVEVYIPGESSQARVKPSGEFTLRFLPPGVYSLVVEIPNSSPFTVEGVSVSDNTISDLGTTAICRDVDQESYDEDIDCNDNNPLVNPMAAESCDGVDNNCDGNVDEGCALCTDDDGDGFFAQIGCTTLVDCDDADPLTSPVAAEVCDNRDNDCDLLIDEDIDLDVDASNCGVCGNVCSFPNALGVCSGGLCDLGSCAGAFSNCDGLPDNGCETNLNSDVNNCGACGNVCSGPGSFTCSSGICIESSECTEGAFEVCGVSDVGACQLGMRTCSNGSFGECVGSVDPVMEVCGNELDDDCDGVVDNGCAPPPGCTEGEMEACGVSDVGACQLGTRTCSNGMFGACTGSVDPTPELCGNALDDDCDGIVDNGCAPPLDE